MSQPNPIRASTIAGIAFGDIGNTDVLPPPSAARGKALDAGGGLPIVIPGTSGAIPRFNVLDYGAVGNNVTSDTAACQAAINAAHALYIASGARQVVFFPPATYYLPATAIMTNWEGYPPPFGRRPALTIREGVILDGEGAAVLRTPYGSSGVIEGGDYYETVVFAGADGSESNWAIRGLIFDGGNATLVEKNTELVSIGHGTDWEITDCEFKNSQGDGIVLLAGSTPGGAWKINRNDFHHCNGNAIILDAGTSGDPIDDWEVSNNHFTHCHTVAESIGSNGTFRRGRVLNNVMYDWGSVVLGICRDVRIIGNHLTGGALDQSAVLGIRGGSGVRIEDNDLDMSLALAAGGAGADAGCINCTQDAIDGLAIINNRMLVGHGPAVELQTGAGTFFNLRIQDNDIQTMDIGQVENPVLNLKVVTRAWVCDNDIRGVGRNGVAFIGACSIATITGNHLAGYAYIVAPPNSRITSNEITTTQLGPLTVTSDSVISGNRIEADVNGGASLVYVSPGSLHVNISDNVMACADSFVTFVGCDNACDYIHVLDNLFIGQLAGGDGINLVGANSVQRIPA